ncbi:MAG TPA: GNAT family N-acetyltransferase [Pirellulales bacterium]|nr:GNAT family N-acetyltransferase [Pirellulales bacterium]
MYTVREINDLKTLAGQGTLWSSLLPETPGASFFHSVDWLQTYWRHFGAQRRLRVLLVHRGDRCVGILPLVLRRERRLVGTLRVLTYPLDNWASFYGPIGPDPTATLVAGLIHIRDTRRDWDVVELPWVDALGSDQGRTPLAMNSAGFLAHGELRQTSALVDLSKKGGWDGYWASRTSHWRTNVRRSEKKLAERGPVAHVRYRPRGLAHGDADPRWDLYEACEAIAGTSWQGSSQTGTTLTHEAIRPFLRDLHIAAANVGALDLNLLLMDGKSVAFNYAYHYRGHVFGLRTGYDREFSAQGPGTVLQARMIEDSFARGDHTYDLGPDYLACKRHWQTHTQGGYRFTHFAPRAPVAQLVRAKRKLQGWFGRGQRGSTAGNA